MSTNGHLFHLIPAYALGSLDEQEALQVRQHLKACNDCQEELRAYEIMIGLLPAALPRATPPDALRARLLTGIIADSQPEPVAKQEDVPIWNTNRSPSWWEKLTQWRLALPLAPAFAALSLLLVLAVSTVLLWGQVSDLQSQIIDTEMIVLPLIPGHPGSEMTGILVMDPQGIHGTIIVNALPLSKEGQEYQVWLSKENTLDSGGTFTIQESGYGAQYIHSDDHLRTYARVWVTIEPEGGSEQPTGEIVLQTGP